MEILLDTNVILDVLLNREPWVRSASIIWRAIDEKRITGYIAACTLADIAYIAQRLKDQAAAHVALNLCLKTFDICPVDRRTVDEAIQLPGKDFEDNVQISCAVFAGVAAIITRDSAGFQATTIPALSPDEFVETYLL
jgi:predicted nucleic acid-binding protein